MRLFNKSFILIFVLIFLLLGCKKNNDLDSIISRGEIVAVTIEGASSYYVRDSLELGLDFILASKFADYLGVNLRVIVAKSEKELTKILSSGKADFAAYKIAHNDYIKRKFRITDIDTTSHIVLIQNNKSKLIHSLNQLENKEIHIQKKYLPYVKNLKDISFLKSLPDSLSPENIIRMVRQGTMLFGAVDEEVAYIADNQLYKVNTGLALSDEYLKSWIVRKNTPELDSVINFWCQEIKSSGRYKQIEDSCFSNNSYFVSTVPYLKNSISPYDSIFRVHSRLIDWDWRLLAAVAYHESRFNPNTVSSNGAKGIMQMMSATGKKFGLTDSTFFSPDENIKAGAKLLASLDNIFSDIENKNERIKVVLASYNAGHGHLQDAINLTKKYNGNPQIWTNNIEKYLMLKSEEKYYNDSVVRLGYYRANHTIGFVRKVLNTYNNYMGYVVE